MKIKKNFNNYKMKILDIKFFLEIAIIKGMKIKSIYTHIIIKFTRI